VAEDAAAAGNGAPRARCLGTVIVHEGSIG
jgi:hypothetical protein